MATDDIKSGTTSWKEQANKKLHSGVTMLNNAFNGLSMQAKKTTLLTTGTCIAAFCLLSLRQGFMPSNDTSIKFESMTKPLTQQPMQTKPDTTELIPLGKMKGEVNGKFEAFYVAMDRRGNFFKNENPAYSNERWKMSPDWKPLSYNQFMQYDKQLQFLPLKSKQLKP